MRSGEDGWCLCGQVYMQCFAHVLLHSVGPSVITDCVQISRPSTSPLPHFNIAVLNLRTPLSDAISCTCLGCFLWSLCTQGHFVSDQ